RAHDRLRRRGAEAAWPALPCHAAVDRRYGVRGAEDLRSRGLAAGPRHLPRDFQLLELRRLPGPAYECALSTDRWQGNPARAHAEWFWPCDRPHDDRDHRELSAPRRHRRDPRGVASLYGRA